MFDANPVPLAERELILDRLIDAPRDKLFRCWSNPKLLEQWFCPKPWRVTVQQMDFRSGGASAMTMHGPDGETMPNKGVYLEVVPNEKIVFTDAFVNDWDPSAKPFFVAIVTFADEGGKTRYVAKARHWTVQDRDAHEKMGFHEGWRMASDQLEALAKSL
jgi:uncharacterized protein YndB with AHSA1/START domain